MKHRFLKLILLLQVSGLAVQASGAAPEALSSLLANSPFGQQAAPTGAAATTTLELRGVIVDNGEVLFSLFDPASRVSRWVGLNEAGNPFTVRSYDSKKSEVKVSYQGRELVLGLKQSTIIALAATPGPSVGPVPSPTSMPSAGPPGAPSDEAVRLAQIAEEIGRRRALRQQAQQQSNASRSPAAPNK